MIQFAASPLAPESIALAVFRQSPMKYNCAQSVVHAHRMRNPYCALRTEDFSECGGGHAPWGVCGALYAAQTIAHEHAGKILEVFTAKAGVIGCRRCAGEGRLSCEERVALAARLSSRW